MVAKALSALTSTDPLRPLATDNLRDSDIPNNQALVKKSNQEGVVQKTLIAHQRRRMLI